MTSGARFPQILELIAQRPPTGWDSGAFERPLDFVLHPPGSTDFKWPGQHFSDLQSWNKTRSVDAFIPIPVVAILTDLMAGQCVTLTTNNSAMVPPATAPVSQEVAGVRSIADGGIDMPATAMVFLFILYCGMSLHAAGRRA